MKLRAFSIFQAFNFVHLINSRCMPTDSITDRTFSGGRIT
ncbi:unnamed protein product [Brugia timori]|uniref:Uncharacterized protein n=1 Tax=Brugia timori TaxID=42155 RepID=A0A0R3QGE0_9BILA|nr:unnamed protein product [Brugia timori]